jgi:hypothetical protein
MQKKYRNWKNALFALSSIEKLNLSNPEPLQLLLAISKWLILTTAKLNCT